MIRFLLYVMFIYIQTLRVTLDKDAKALKVLRKFTFNSVRFFEINLPEKEKLKQWAQNIMLDYTGQMKL